MKAECPICKGTGTFDMPHRIQMDTLAIKRYLAVELRKNGYSIRQIMAALGYKSPISIQLILKQEEKEGKS